MTRSVAVGLAQITGAAYAAQANLQLSVDVARELFDRGAEIVVLPELIVSGYVADPARLTEVAEPLDGPSVTAWGELASRTGGFVAGGFCERDGDAIYNSAVVVSPDGVLLHYRKLHLFGAEKLAFVPGNLGLPVAQARFGTVGLCVCYDLRFVETVRALTLQGAELICVPTAWLPGFDSERWDAEGFCPQARGALLQANLDQAFIACASQFGDGGDGPQFLGSSVLCDPYGKALLGPMAADRQQLAIATVDLDAVEQAHEREAMVSPQADRRTDVYGLSVGGHVL
jgi:predicted amidohydrolase